MDTSNSSLQASASESPVQSRDVSTPGPIERGINTTGLTMTVGGSLISLIRPEIGYAIAGTGVGLVVGGLAVGYAIRHGNG